jgi:hypothetical protein
MQRLRDLSQQVQQRFRYERNRDFGKRVEAAQKVWDEIKTKMDDADSEMKFVKAQWKRFQFEENGGMEEFKCPFGNEDTVATKNSNDFDKMLTRIMNLNLVHLKPGDKVWRINGTEATVMELVQFRLNDSGEDGSLVWKLLKKDDSPTARTWSKYRWNGYDTVAFLPMTLKVPLVDDLLSDFVNLDLGGGVHKEDLLDVETCKKLYDTYFGPDKAKMWIM